VQHLGAAGDVVKVKDGYARTTLLRRARLPGDRRQQEEDRLRGGAHREATRAEKGAAETEATRIAEVHLSFTVKW